jgi:hypothetical protein
VNPDGKKRLKNTVAQASLDAGKMPALPLQIVGLQEIGNASYRIGMKIIVLKRI